MEAMGQMAIAALEALAVRVSATAVKGRQTAVTAASQVAAAAEAGCRRREMAKALAAMAAMALFE